MVDVLLPDGRTLHAYDVPVADERLAVLWHAGTPNTGEPPEPLLDAARRRGIRWVGYDRPSYGGSTPDPGRSVASAAPDTAAVAHALGIERFAVMGHSGGGPHALACAALLPDRVTAAVCGSSPAPVDAAGLDYFAGMGSSGRAELGAATRGREALAAQLATGEFDPEMFTAADGAALEGDWAWLGRIAGAAMAAGPDGMIDDDLALVGPWGFDPADVHGPTLFLHGLDDRMVPASHGRWLASRVPSSTLWLRPGDGHVSVLAAAAEALDWLIAQSAR
ncbi:alpha/beta fold hydrolase [Cellulomonas sp. McL0617]|uniref:alpha/beta fold hydrolase n=1 Tax=Cellulomonas sp. McL0617 TaxID=3415675 RepID=UPI003CF3A171